MKKSKIKRDTGGGCSICGRKPAVNVEGTYWLCGSCVNEEIEQRDEVIKAMRVLLRQTVVPWEPI
jgi:hypothetical protein